jgi:hypothetical protein
MAIRGEDNIIRGKQHTIIMAGVMVKHGIMTVEAMTWTWI